MGPEQESAVQELDGVEEAPQKQKVEVKIPLKARVMLTKLNLANGGFNYVPIPEIMELRKKVPFMPDSEFLEYLSGREGFIRCNKCLDPAEHYETLSNDSLYKATLCTVCRNKRIADTVKLRMRNGKDPHEGKYLITSQESSDAAKKENKERRERMGSR